jgi:hypothetical protein
VLPNALLIFFVQFSKSKSAPEKTQFLWIADPITTQTMAKSGKQQPTLDDLIRRVSYHTPNPTLLNGAILPFALLLVTWLYLWFVVYGLDDYYEAGFIGVAVIAVLQIFVCLCCFWSVHVQTFLNCRTVGSAIQLARSLNYVDI